MKASLIITGDEITRGIVQDAYLKIFANFLSPFLISVESCIIVPDSDNLSKYIDFASGYSDIILTTGGLGPTEDDKTRAQVAKALKRELVFSQSAEACLERAVGKNSSIASNKIQAFVPAGFNIIDNLRGSACGFWGEEENKLYISLPGPIFETQGMMEELSFIISQFLKRNNREEGARKCASYSLFLLPEAKFNDISNEILERLAMDKRNFAVGTCFSQFKIDIYLYYRDEADELRYIEALKKELLKLFSFLPLLKGSIDLVEEFAKCLKDKGLSVSTAESLTCGLLATTITKVPGSSEFYLSGVNTYSNEFKRKLLGVDEGVLEKHSAVSSQCALGMVRGCHKLFSSDVAIALTGYAGPGADKDSDVGKVFVGIGTEKGRVVNVYELKFSGSRQSIRNKAVAAALFLALKELRALY